MIVRNDKEKKKSQILKNVKITADARPARIQ